MKRQIYLTIDIYKRNTFSEILKQLDTTELIISLYKNNEKLNIKEIMNNVYFQLNFLKADKTLCVMKDQSKFSVEENILKIDLDKDCLRVAGRGLFEIFMYKDDTFQELLSTFLIPVMIESSVSDKTPSKNKIDILEKINVIISSELNEALKVIDKKVEEANNSLNNLNQAIEDSKTAIDHATVVTKDELTEEVQKQLSQTANETLKISGHTVNKMFKTNETGNIVETSFNADILDNTKSNIQEQLDKIIDSLDNISFSSVYAKAIFSENVDNNSDLELIVDRESVRLNNNCFNTNDFTLKATATYEINIQVMARANTPKGSLSEIQIQLNSEKNSIVSNLTSSEFLYVDENPTFRKITTNINFLDNIQANSKLKIKLIAKDSPNRNSVWFRVHFNIKKL